MAKLPKFIDRRYGIEDRIYLGITDRNGREDRTVDPRLIRASSIGQCPRRIWASLSEIPESKSFSERLLAVFQLGHALEDLIVEHLRDAGFRVSDQQKIVEINTAGGMIRGHIDGIIWVKGEKHLLEIKTANDSRYDSLIDCGYEIWNEGYRDQLHTYMGGLDLKSAIVVVYNKNDSRIYAEKIKFNTEVFEACKDKAARIFIHMINQKSIERPENATSKSCQFCRWCSHADWCWSSVADVRFDE